MIGLIVLAAGLSALCFAFALWLSKVIRRNRIEALQAEVRIYERRQHRAFASHNARDSVYWANRKADAERELKELVGS